METRLSASWNTGTSRLKNFLKGMETSRGGLSFTRLRGLKNFLKGMETR